MAPRQDKPAKSPGDRHERAKDFRPHTPTIDVMPSNTVKETTMTRCHANAQTAQQLVVPPDPFMARDRAHELRSRYLSHLADVLRAALARAIGRTVDSDQAANAWQRR